MVEDLKRELPNLATFVTLSPVPGFAAWLDRERKSATSVALTEADKTTLALLDQPDWPRDPAKRDAVRKVLVPAAAWYLLRAKTPSGKPLDPVARFHLGNGARLERLNFLGDLSDRGLRQAHGMMVNYLYKLDDIETNHERFADRREVVAASGVRKLLPNRDLPSGDAVPEDVSGGPAKDRNATNQTGTSR